MAAPEGPSPAEQGGPADRADIVVVGAGIVGLATALRLLQGRPELRVVVLEKEPRRRQPPDGPQQRRHPCRALLRAWLAEGIALPEGKRDLEAYCEAAEIPIKRTGKLVIATHEGELARFAALHQRASANGVPGLEEVGPERITELEPHAAGIRALWSPSTAVVDFRAVATAFAADVGRRGGHIETGRAVTGLTQRGEEMIVSTSRGEVVARRIITCAGLQADRVAAMAPGSESEIAPHRAVPRRLLRAAPRGAPTRPRPHLPRARPALPVPRRPSHEADRRAVLAGPNAVLAMAREGYRRRDVVARDLAETLAFPGFRRLALRYWRAGAAELWRDWSRRAYAGDLRRYVPALAAEHLDPGPSGVRAQALGRDGRLVDDFLLGGSDRVLHVLNAPSPAATSVLAIGRVLAGTAIDRFGL